MAFGESLNKLSRQSEDQGRTQEVPFVRLGEHERVFRIMDTREFMFWSAWFKVNVRGQKVRRSVILGTNDVINEWNSVHGYNRGDPDYISPRPRFAVNVLDRTKVIRKDGDVLFPNKTGRYEDANGRLVSGTPEDYNKVLIWEFGKSTLETIVSLSKYMRSRNNPQKSVSINDVDIIVVSEGEGLRRAIRVLQGFEEGPLPAHLSSLPLYDLQSIFKPFPDEAIKKLLDGEDYYEVLDAYQINKEFPFRQELFG